MRKILLTLLSFLFMACTQVTVQDYKSEIPVLKLENYLSGEFNAYGFFQDRSGKIVKRFKVVMSASWSEGVGTLNEDFFYSDGTKSNRVWTIKKTGENEFSGTASDIIGEAKGVSSGNALHWKYTMDLPVDGKNYHVQLDDWMYLMEDNIMINKSKMSKFGIYLGEVALAFVKKP